MAERGKSRKVQVRKKNPAAAKPATSGRPRKAAKARGPATDAPEQKKLASGKEAPVRVPAPAEPEEQRPEPAVRFPIVGIGASAGGLAAFEAFFSAMPATTESGIAFVLVQHLSPDHKSLLTDLVRRYTSMKVVEAEDGMPLQPGCVHVLPPNRDISLEGAVLRLAPPTEPRGLWLPIDNFFRSLAAALRERAICMVFSGTGSDGTLGLRAVKGEGGLVIVQSPETAEQDGMPRSAIATGLADFVLAPAHIPKQLLAYVRHAFRKPLVPAAHDTDFVRKLCALLRAHTGHDFSQYKETTLIRRLERRMALHQIEQPEDYLRYARDNPKEVEAMFRDLLIGVTNFFRDPEAFKVLEEKVIPQVLESKPSRDPVRIWVCGCSTGEEAYSIAILMQEQIEDRKRPLKVQIFATDIDRNAVEAARAGIFPASIASDVTPERLARFFTHDTDGGTYRIRKVIRDMLVFSEQDVVKDPPFSKLDLVTCRNLLIYLNGDLQKRLLPLFHYALRPGGALFLGPSETVGENAPLFSTVDRKWKLYFRHAREPAGVRPALPSFMPPSHESPSATQRGESEGPRRDEKSNFGHLAEQALLAHYSHAGVLVTARGDILHIVGRTGNFLEPTAGDADMNILAMARDGLRRELSVALHKAVAQRHPVAYQGLRVKTNGHTVNANLVVRPAQGGQSQSDLYLVILEEAGDQEARLAEKAPRDQATRSRIAALEQELRSKEEYLQTTLEEMETTNEELKSTNEEMQSVNEELQSTNEELETSKEELQSVNEELSTVNTELQDKVADLSRVNNDMNNLLAGTGVGTVFVDHQLRISRYTPAATQVINLIPSDVGRPVEHVVPNLVGYDHLVQDIRTVLNSLTPIEAEVQIKSGAWYLMRIRPYRTMDNVIEGAVITLVDISERKRAEQSLRLSEARFQAVIRQAYAGVTETDTQGRFTFVNDRFMEMLGYSREELLHKRMHDITHPEDLTRDTALFDSLVGGGPDFAIEKRYIARDGQPVPVMNRVSAIRTPDGETQSLVAISFDISERKRLEATLSRIDEQLAKDLDAVSRLLVVGELVIVDGNQDVVLLEILDAAIAITGAQMGSLQLVDESAGRLKIAAQRGFSPAWVEFWDKAPPSVGSCHYAHLTGERVLVEDVTQSPLYRGTAALDVQVQAGVRAVQSTPLIGRAGALIGMISTHFSAPRLPDQRTFQLFDLLVRQAADIIERAQAGNLPRGKPS